MGTATSGSAPLTARPRRGTAGLLEAPLEVGSRRSTWRGAVVPGNPRPRQPTRTVNSVVELLSPSDPYSGRGSASTVPRQERTAAPHERPLRPRSTCCTGGPRMPWLDLPPCDYCAGASAGPSGIQKPALWPIRAARPAAGDIPVPLRQGDPDARLDLQEVLNARLRRRGLPLLHLRRPAHAAVVCRGRRMGPAVRPAG